MWPLPFLRRSSMVIELMVLYAYQPELLKEHTFIKMAPRIKLGNISN